MNKDILKKIGLALGVILLFLVLSYGFVPQVLEGKIVNQSDISGYIGMSHEMTEWNRAHPGEQAYWTGSMFGGMPTTAISNVNGGDWTQPLYNFLLTGKRPATYLFLTLLGSFLLMLSLGVNGVLAVGGAVAAAFCAYNFQIIQVGHNTKMQAIAFLPWALAALIFTYRSALQGRNRSRTLLGAALFGLAVSFQVKANHQQITYYLALMILLYALMLLVWVLWKHRDRFLPFVTASLLLLVLGGAGIAANANKLLPLYRYTQHTMRGGSELAKAEEENRADGLALDYATAWSYGWQEFPNLMIPNFNGGASSGAVNPEKSATIRVLRKAGQRNLKETAKGLPMYWGPQPFTAGPMYMGAITVFLFVLGLCLYRGKEKAWFAAVAALAVLMAAGSHFMAFTRLCFNILPFYSKFRTVSMSLVMLQFVLPMLGFLTIDGFVKGKYSRAAWRRGSAVALCVTAGFCLLCWLFPGIAGSFRTEADTHYPEVLAEAFAADRRALLRQDVLTSFLLIAGAFGLLAWAQAGEDRRRRLLSAAGVSALILVNMFAVGKRYLNADDFVTPRNFEAQFAARTADRLILEDPDPSYRVMDLTSNVFNDSHPSYWHKSIGGYSPAKLQRYQDLIDRYLTDEYTTLHETLRGVSTVQEFEQRLPDLPLLNALNCRYLILGAENPPARNARALGNAWFVRSVLPAASPDEELARTGSVDLSETAVVGRDFAEAEQAAEAALRQGAAADSADDGIWLTEYAPNTLRYRYRAAADRVAVFSEIYYPDGWSAEIDGSTEISLFRADWTLRAAVLPAGEHELLMQFAPASYRVGARISRAGSLLLLLLALFAIGGIALPLRKENPAAGGSAGGRA